jgi:transposase
MSIADVTAARSGHAGRVASPDGPRASRPKRRTFTREYKVSILGQYEAASTPQERNGLLRREGIYSAYITEWCPFTGCRDLAFS